MSMDAPVWYRESYSSDLRHAFQSGGYQLKGTVMPPARMEGKTIYFPIMGKTSMTKKQRLSQAPTSNTPRSMVSVTSEFFENMEPIETTDINQIAPDERAALAKVQGMAAGRKHDEIIYEAIHAESGNYGAVIGAYNEALDPAKILRVQQALMSKDVPWEGDCYLPIPSTAWGQLMLYKEFTNADYVGDDLPWVKKKGGRVWNGLTIFPISDAVFPRGANNNELTLYAYHKSAIGCGSIQGDMPQKHISWQTGFTAWWHHIWMDMGAKVIQKEPIVELRMNYDAATIVMPA